MQPEENFLVFWIKKGEKKECYITKGIEFDGVKEVFLEIFF